MALIDLIRDALRFLPPKSHHFLTLEGRDGQVRLISSDFRRLFENWNTYGEPELADEKEAFNRAIGEIKGAIAEGRRKKSYQHPYEKLKPANGPVCALHVEAKEDFTVVEDGDRINLIEGSLTFAITDSLRKVVADKSTKVFVNAEAGELEALEFVAGDKTYFSEPFTGHPIIPLHLTKPRKIAERWSRAQCAVNLVIINASEHDKGELYAVKRKEGITLHWYASDSKYLLNSVDDSFVELDEHQTIIFYDVLEHKRVRLYWETAQASYSWVMRLHEM
ncbi:MAG: hypothetical protein EPN26_05000 [Rhodospirillales bacterium]|nr:MAG: hypothetical protein EPN26_05000 [Rhodospirillales bacterium]